MSAFTAHDLSTLFEDKGYTGLTQFYSPSFEFTDTLKAGLERVQKEFAGQASPNMFSLSSYPVWEQQGNPYVSSYVACSYKDEQFRIRLLDLSYNRGTYNGEISRQLLKEPAAEDIPDKQHLSDTLKNLTGGGNELRNRNNKKHKL
ncbi:hypothetical protein FMM05_10310 [Flavobacterium zepuense]|uniref:Uncharacterized protein n=1 Tax=Flavobacterium zepuense TaxID=2593302 RepID=A0A552V192_9FLAO|nr:hypothetical protein [Flavobacterium zepuense]TRW24220.1 hypothetical protein FMM05_10310 [Flavobacterium zepuense]